MTDGEGEISAIECVEMKLIDTLAAERLDLSDRERRGDHAARLGIVLEPIETMPQPFGDLRPTSLGKAQHLRKTRDRQNTRHQAGANAGGRTAIAETQEHIGVEKELRDGAIGASVDLGLEIVQVEGRAGRLGMTFRKCRHGDLEIGDALEAAYQVDGVGKASGMG